MDLAFRSEQGIAFLEGGPDEGWLVSANDAARVIEACFSHGTQTVLLYAANLPMGFFDISTGEAGELLQKLRNYRIRLAVVCPPGEFSFSSRFDEMIADEARGTHFGWFAQRADALAWLQRLAASI